ncbi:hypothetical protein BJX64DRAFT_279244 [Aspergillus heterothallicus]
MTAPKLPCSNCRSDQAKPKCARCTARGLECIPVERKAVFRRGARGIPGTGEWGSVAQQTWVNSEPRKWRRMAAGALGAGSGGSGGSSTILGAVSVLPNSEGVGRRSGFSGEIEGQTQAQVPVRSLHEEESQVLSGPHGINASPAPHDGCFNPLDTLVSAAAGLQGWSPASIPESRRSIGASHGSHASPYGGSHNSPRAFPTGGESIKPLESVEESCLIRYFIEELSPWFDHCDDRRHFALVVPLRAHSCLTVRNAIFAVSSRHLSRVPRYKTPHGILYHGQLLPDLTTSSAVEYMLKCIPGLLTFHDAQDPEKQENLMAATIILRQYEEMEEEMEEGEAETIANSDVDVDGLPSGREQRVNFLAITQAIIYSMISSPLGRSSLATAAYWIAIRQEVYYALTRKRVPCITFTREDWETATVANTMIMHAGEVTKWCWGDRSVQEYERLKHQQQTLTSDYSTHLLPILQKPPDPSKGEIFPTVWYATDAQVTGAQHLELARMILTAENPALRNPTTPRATHRKAESHVRSIVLNLCGIAVDNSPRRMPALVNAVIAIMLYGEFFTDGREREALVGVIERTKGMHAWPLKRPFERLRAQWGVFDENNMLSSKTKPLILALPKTFTNPADLPTLVAKYKLLRLHSLTTDPDAFSSTLSRESTFTDKAWETRLLNPVSTTLIAIPSDAGQACDEILSRGDVSTLIERAWVGQVTLLGPVALHDFAGEEEYGRVEKPWEVFDGIDFLEAARTVSVLERGSRVVYLLAGMYVCPKVRGAGYGRGLVEQALQTVGAACDSRGWKGVVVVMVTPGNEGAKRLYEKAGFVAREETISVGGNEECVLEWQIGP